MKWSLKIGEVSGIGIYIHTTFLILLGWVALSHWRMEQRIAAVAEGVTFIALLFACIVLHELGHALTAKRYGIKTRDMPVRDVMQTDFHTVDGSEMLETAFQALQACECHTLPVVRDGRLLGLVTMDNVGEFLMIQSALKEGRRVT